MEENDIIKDEQYEKDVNRTSNIILIVLVVVVISLAWCLTSIFYKRQTGGEEVLTKAKRIELTNIKDAKIIKEYEYDDIIDSFDFIEFGTYNNKKIEWVVLKAEKGEALVVSKYVLKSLPFYDNDSKNFFENWWQISNIKKWLNDEFYNKSFTVNEKNLIVEKGFLSKERITILDNQDIKKFFGENDKKVIESHTKTRLFPGVSDENIEISNGYVPYWTKTIKSNRVSVINSSGELNEDGYRPTNKTIGIRPAIYIKY